LRKMCRSSSNNRFGDAQINMSNSGRAERVFFPPPNRSDLLGWPIQRLIPWVPVDVPPGAKRAGCGADHSLSSSAEVKREWMCTSTPVLCFHCVYRDSFTIALAFMNQFCAESTLF
jgi:hypothetical protein